MLKDLFISFKVKKHLYGILCFLTVLSACNSTTNISIPIQTELEIKSNEGLIHGSLLQPANTNNAMPLVIIIAGSGPTDRNGNSVSLNSDAYKLVADSLAKKGIASYRYDKRGVGASNDFKMSEVDMRFDDFVTDAVACIKHFKADKKYSKIIIAGHSEGALIGLLASKLTKTDAYICLCGAGRPIADVLKEQLAQQPDAIKNECYRIIDSLQIGVEVKNVVPMLASLFRESVQPYMISWMKYKPSEEISELKIPSLIIAGDSDIQVSVADADSLKKANPDSEYKIISGMNHIFRTGFKNEAENSASYNKPQLPISTELVQTISDFILGLK